MNLTAEQSAILKNQINPLTATWERYDLSTWRPEQSLEFMECLMELQRRG
jgi:hypothetical protein